MHNHANQVGSQLLGYVGTAHIRNELDIRISKATNGYVVIDQSLKDGDRINNVYVTQYDLELAGIVEKAVAAFNEVPKPVASPPGARYPYTDDDVPY